MRRAYFVVPYCAAMLAASAAAAQPASVANGGESPVFVVTSPFHSPSLSTRHRMAHADTAREAQRIVGLRGSVIGAFIGVGIGVLAVQATCDAQDCDSHPDTQKIMIGAAAVGALGGFLLDHAWHAIRRNQR